MVRAVVRPAQALVLLLLASCDGEAPRSSRSPASLERDLAALERGGAAHQERLDHVRDAAARLREATTTTVREFRAAEADFQRARETMRRASADYERGSAAAQAARADFEHAAEQYHQVTALVVAAAGLDLAGAHLCQGAMSTSTYRRQLTEAGVDLTGVDIDHVFPHARGGANHPLNYQPLASSLNRSLGADLSAKLAAMPAAVLQGALVSALMRLQCTGAPGAFRR